MKCYLVGLSNIYWKSWESFWIWLDDFTGCVWKYSYGSEYICIFTFIFIIKHAENTYNSKHCRYSYWGMSSNPFIMINIIVSYFLLMNRKIFSLLYLYFFIGNSQLQLDWRSNYSNIGPFALFLNVFFVSLVVNNSLYYVFAYLVSDSDHFVLDFDVSHRVFKVLIMLNIISFGR